MKIHQLSIDYPTVIISLIIKTVSPTDTQVFLKMNDVCLCTIEKVDLASGG